MKNLEFLVPSGHTFVVDEEKPFLITSEDFRHISRIGVLVHMLLERTVDGLGKDPHVVSTVLFDGLDEYYRQLGTAHPQMYPTLIRVDLMVDIAGNWKIAEIDPANKHGMGFALATRYESGAGNQQKLLSLVAPFVTDDVTVVLGRQEEFFRLEQRYFAKMLAEYTGKRIEVVSEDGLPKKLRRGKGLILDFPFCNNLKSREVLGRRFLGQPEVFFNPPRHALGSKALMTLPWEHEEWLEHAGMSMTEIRELRKYLPPTYLGPFVVKDVLSSGARGVSFDAISTNTVSQKYLKQRTFSFGRQEKFIRMACIFIGSSLAELTVSTDTKLPVHGGDSAVHYHVEVV